MIRPRPYLSWSQMNVLETSEKTYIKLYVHGESLPINRGMAYGSKMADAMENDEDTGDIALDFAMSLLPKAGTSEKEIDWEVMGVPIFGKMDHAKEDLSLIDEYKTGVEKSWNQNKANQSAEKGQLCFYGASIYFKTKKIPKARLSFVPTIKNDLGEVEATGEVITFNVEIKMKDVLVMAVRMKRAWKEIGEMCERELFEK